MFSFLTKKKKLSRFPDETSYSLLIYSNKLGEQEKIWNRTTLRPPSYVISNKTKEKLIYQNPDKNNINVIHVDLQPGMRYFDYKSSEDWVKERLKLSKIYWEHNFNNCKEKYETFEEFFAISCKTMDKARLEIKIQK